MTADKIPPKPSKDVVYVDLDDEITSIIDKVENTKNSVVALVLPKRASVLQSIVNMRLLKRAADSASKNVVLISSEAALAPLAGAAGLHVAKNLQSKPHIPPSPIPINDASSSIRPTMEPADEEENEIEQSNAKIDYGRSIGELAAGHEVEEPETIPLSDKGASGSESGGADKPSKIKHLKDKRLKVPNFDKFRLSLGLGIGGLVILILIIFLATSVLPKATIILKTTSLPISANFNLTADTSAKTLDEANNVIPATVQTKDQTAIQTVTATGQQNNGDKAKGSVSMSGGACSATVPSDVPAGTGLSTSGLTYITGQKTSFAPVVSGGKCTFQSTSSTPITAQTGGSKYNVSSVNFSVSGRSDVSASGSASGGTDNVATVLSQSDVDGAKQKITSTDTDQFTKDFEKALSDQGLYVIASTLKLSDPVATSSTPVGQPATSATVTVKITYTLLTVKNEDLRKVVTTQTAKQIEGKNQKLGSDDVLEGLTVSVSAQDSATKASLALTENTTAVPVLDIVAIKKIVAGQKRGNIQAALGDLPGVNEVEVKLSPFWVSKVPQKAGKINVIEQQASGGNSSP
ncbi:hypothetical protein HYS42_00785 [Candidatus Saccharibacteria bacterium]|nr:hypothetical protein [Candidatus Saccharibacteria bacterium]